MSLQSAITTKIQTLFDLLLQQTDNVATLNIVYFEKLIRHLSSSENAFILESPFALKWADTALKLISDHFCKIDYKLIAFVLNFCALLTQNEWAVIEIREKRIIDRVIIIVEKHGKRFHSSIKIGVIRLFAAVARYSLGLAYLRSVKAWRFLYDFCNNDHTLYVVREARQFLYDMLYKFSVKTNDQQIVLEILHEIVKPILDNVYSHSNENIKISVGDTELERTLSSRLDLMSYIFQKTLESEEKTNIAQLCLQHFDMPVTFWKLFDMTLDANFVEKILVSLSSFNFAILVFEKWQIGSTIAPENFNQFGVLVFNLEKLCIARRDCVNFVKVAQMNYIIWKKLGARAPKEIFIENDCIKFENQLILFHILPLFAIMRTQQLQEEEIFDQYINKLFEVSCEHTWRICYGFRDALAVDANGPPIHVCADLVTKSINGILSMENILEREQAVLVFQALMYCLKEFTFNSSSQADCVYTIPSNEVIQGGCRMGPSWPKDIELIEKMPNVLYSVFIALQRLIQRYNISWKESIETICLVNAVAFMLKNPNMTSRVAVQAIKLVQLSIEHFLSPNMALLVDNLEGSGLICLGPIIVERCQDTTWEVRDSTLELATSIANISRLKFPAFRKFLIDFNVCPLVLELVRNDDEPYVRASAFKCLAQMVPLNAIWDKYLNKLEVIQHLFVVLHNESEAIVRKEAICMLTQIFDLRKMPTQCHELLYSTFAYAVVSDLHWEVKLHGLQFWELEMQKQCTNHGMIDGTFPTVTFSKQEKKIVTLTEDEIKLRIVKIFQNLSQLGCLGVLLKSLNDDCDLEVAKETVNIVRRLVAKLEKYDFENILLAADNFSENNANAFTSLNSITGSEDISTVEAYTAADPTLNADEIIDKILSTQDIAYVLATSQQTENAPLQYLDANYYKKFASISPKQFIVAIKSIDFNQMLQNHNDWFLGTDSILSLIDDMLVAIEPISEDCIIADCY